MVELAVVVQGVEDVGVVVREGDLGAARVREQGRCEAHEPRAAAELEDLWEWECR